MKKLIKDLTREEIQKICDDQFSCHCCPLAFRYKPDTEYLCSYDDFNGKIIILEETINQLKNEEKQWELREIEVDDENNLH